MHQIAGNLRVVELHGTMRRVACLACGAEYEAEPLTAQFLASGSVPDCQACGGYLKHATISFGQNLSPDVLREAFLLANRCDVLFAIGSSLVVHPAAMLPEVAKQHAARLVIVNRDETPLDDLADAVLRTPIGETLAELDRIAIALVEDARQPNEARAP